MSCEECRNIGPFQTIQYYPPDEFAPDGSFELCGGDYYYNITGVKYCPFCGARLKPPKNVSTHDLRKIRTIRGRTKISDQVDNWIKLGVIMKEWSSKIKN